jgi:hypothetical protein
MRTEGSPHTEAAWRGIAQQNVQLRAKVAQLEKKLASTIAELDPRWLMEHERCNELEQIIQDLKARPNAL